jgi:hypothetical protein
MLFALMISPVIPQQPAALADKGSGCRRLGVIINPSELEAFCSRVMQGVSSSD